MVLEGREPEDEVLEDNVLDCKVAVVGMVTSHWVVEGNLSEVHKVAESHKAVLRLGIHKVAVGRIGEPSFPFVPGSRWANSQSLLSEV
jgi:hypothetical protein